jgi:asparagine synthase (glutamine-hydrolysing)
MSAVAGIIQFDGAPIEPDVIERMTCAMASRGPDGFGHWKSTSAALGHCAFRTTPESLNERLPLTRADAALVLVMDGHVDNRDDLRRDLESRGAILRDDSDAELVLAAYEQWGDESASRVIGELVFFVWDRRRRTLFAARDAAGTRHFYYCATEAWFTFASEIEGVLASDRIRPQLNDSRLLDSWVDEFDRDDEVGTLYKGIERLPAGHAMRVDDRGVRTWRYWNPAALQRLRFRSLNECAEAFAAELGVAIRSRLRTATGSIGAQLSGGLDSSSIVAMIGKQDGEWARPLKTFSLVRDDRERCPEWQSVQHLVEGGWIESHELSPGAEAAGWRCYLEGLPKLNEPAAFNAGYTEFLLCRAARRAGCRVLLDGTAGDLLFYSFRSSLLRCGNWSELRGVWQAVRRHHQQGMARMLVGRAVRRAVPPPLGRAGARLRPMFWRPGLSARLLRHDVARTLIADRLSDRRRRAGGTDASDTARHAAVFTSGLLSYAHEINGQVALSSGIEPRSPFSDRRMIEFAVRMPREAKLASSWYKRLLRESMSGILPEAVRWREDVGMHPGGEFRRRLIADIAAGAPEIWNRADLESKLAPWIDARKLGLAWSTHERTGDLEAGLSLLSLVASAQWMSARFGTIVRHH